MPVTASTRLLSNAAREDTDGDYFTVLDMAYPLDTLQPCLGRLLPAIDLPVAQLNCDRRGWWRSSL
jgi:hypothetical protein